MEKKSNPHNTAQKAAMYVSSISIIVNLLLSLFKLIAGIIARSDAMISEAVHSASDVLSTIVVIVGSKISSKESDTEHPYGHERIECVSSIILSGMLLVTGIGIGIVGVKKIIAGSTGDDLTVPGILALMAAVVSIIVKEWMYWFTRSVAPPFRCSIFYWFVCGDFGGKAWLSYFRFNCQRYHLCGDCEGVHGYFL